jgi:hypothetical protein
MKRTAVFLILLLAAAGAFAVDFTTFESGFNQFAQDLATGAPFNSTTGLTWSNATGQFPHFGVGLTVGATTIPAASIDTMATALGITLPAAFSYVKQIGMPIPTYTIDARIGGFVLPFDIGLKAGFIPAGALEKISSTISADFLLLGGDVRYSILKDEGFMPNLSIGLGYTYLQESLSVTGLMPSGISVANVNDGSSTHTLTLSDPKLQISTQTNIIEAKLQLSKRLLFLTPYAGAAAAFSFGSSASGSVASTLLFDGSPITQTDIDNINAYYALQGKTPPSMSSTGFTASATAEPGMDYRVYGGLSIDIFFIVLDLNAAYDISTGGYGAAANLRLAL